MRVESDDRILRVVGTTLEALLDPPFQSDQMFEGQMHRDLELKVHLFVRYVGGEPIVFQYLRQYNLQAHHCVAATYADSILSSLKYIESSTWK